MDSFQAFRDAITAKAPPTELFDKPFKPEPPLDSAIWRFLKAWQDTNNLGPDHAVLLRQVLQWGANGSFIGDLEKNIHPFLKHCSVEIDASGIAKSKPFLPTWIKSDILPDTGIDTVPDARQHKHPISSEGYLATLKRKSGPNEYVGYDSWKATAQKEGVWLTLTANPGSTNLVVLPTGMGKSLCFQLLPIFSSGLTIVIVPTIALAIDQYMQAKVAFRDLKDVNPQYFAANDPDIDPAMVVDQINQGKTRLVFTSPEACVSGRLRSAIDNAAKRGLLDNLVIDEAHLVSSWGVYFRVDFQLLAGLRRQWKEHTNGNLRTFLFTATLTQKQKEDVFDLYSDEDSERRDFLFHSLRPEIVYFDRCFKEKNQQFDAVKECLWHLPRPAILYTTKVDAAETLYRQITTELGFTRVGCFTGKTNSRERRLLLDQWRQDKLDLMVATSAFGLGVDKSDVRTVIHSCLPEDLNRYYQEVGRSGRDGYSAISILIPTEKDIKTAEGMRPKLLGTDLIQRRWQSMWETKQEVNPDEYEWSLRLNSTRPKLLGDRTYTENVLWNKRLILQLARAGHIEITNLTVDSELSEKLGEYQEHVSLKIKPGFDPASPKVGKSIENERSIEAEQNSHGFKSLSEHLESNRCISRILKELYGEDTLRSCGGCRWCRNDKREPTDAPVYEYDTLNKTRHVEVIESCPSPFDSTPRKFTRLIRECLDIGVRQFACSEQHHSALLGKFNRALGPQTPFRLDGVKKDRSFHCLSSENLVVFHCDQPFQSLVSITGASKITHMLCGSLRWKDIRYLLSEQHIDAKFIPTLSMWH